MYLCPLSICVHLCSLVEIMVRGESEPEYRGGLNTGVATFRGPDYREFTVP